MKVQKSQIVTAILLVMTIFLIGLIIFIGTQLSNQNTDQISISPRKTKAQSTNYSKLIALNQNSNSSTITPTNITTPTIAPSVAEQAPSKLTPTETILAITKLPNSAINDGASVSSPSSVIPSKEILLSGTSEPSKPKSLPKTGVVTNSIIIFAAAGLLVFFSFIL